MLTGMGQRFLLLVKQLSRCTTPEQEATLLRLWWSRSAGYPEDREWLNALIKSTVRHAWIVDSASIPNWARTE